MAGDRGKSESIEELDRGVREATHPVLGTAFRHQTDDGERESNQGSARPGISLHAPIVAPARHPETGLRPTHHGPYYIDALRRA